MGYYNYKRVMHRPGYEDVAARVFAEERVHYPEAEDTSYECGYDGGGWLVVERWLDEKDAEISRLAADRDKLMAALSDCLGEIDAAVSMLVLGLPPSRDLGAGRDRFRALLAEMGRGG